MYPTNLLEYGTLTLACFLHRSFHLHSPNSTPTARYSTCTVRRPLQAECGMTIHNGSFGLGRERCAHGHASCIVIGHTS